MYSFLKGKGCRVDENNVKIVNVEVLRGIENS